MTALDYPASWNDHPDTVGPDTVRILLEHGADVNTKDVEGELHSIIVKLSYIMYNHPSIQLYTFISLYIKI